MPMELGASAGGHAHQGHDHALALDAEAGCSREIWPVDLRNFGEIEMLLIGTCAFGTERPCSRDRTRHFQCPPISTQLSLGMLTGRLFRYSALMFAALISGHH